VDEMPMRRFGIRFLGVLITALVLVAVFNAVVDPFGVTGWNRLGVFEVREREYKSQAVGHTPHDAILISHSRLSAQDPREVDGYTFFNMAVGGGRLEELAGMLEPALDDQEVVVLGLDFWMFNARYWPELKGGWKPITIRRLFTRYLLSWDYFLSAWSTIRASMEGRDPVIRPPGFLDAEFWRKEGETDPDRKEMALQSVVLNYEYGDFRMKHLRTMKVMLEEKGIPLVVFLHPESPILREHLASPELAGAYQTWRAEVETLFPDLIDLTDSKYAKAENYYRYDPIHYRPEVSTAFLNEVVVPEIHRRLKP